MRNLVAEVFKDVSYVLDDEAYSTTDSQEYVRKRFIRAWESVEGYKVGQFQKLRIYSDLFKEYLMERNYTMLFVMAVEILPWPLEKMAMSTKFNEVALYLYLFIYIYLVLTPIFSSELCDLIVICAPSYHTCLLRFPMVTYVRSLFGCNSLLY